MKWRNRKIGEVAKVKGGKRLPKGMSVLDEPTDHPYLRVVDFGDSGIDRSNIKYLGEEAFEAVKRYTIDSSNIYISIAGTIGRVGVVPNDLSGSNLTENAAKITEISSDVDHRYLMYYLRSPLGRGAILNRTGGTSQPKLALCRIEEIDFPCPPIQIQQQIADVLFAYDDLIENNRRRIQLLEQSARLLYKEWFVHLRFPGHQHVKITDGVPEGWEAGVISDFFDTTSGGTPSRKHAEFYEGDINWVKTQELNELFIFETEEKITQDALSKSSAKLFPENTLLVSIYGGTNIGRTGILARESASNQACVALFPKHETANHIFAQLFFQNLRGNLIGLAQGVAQTNISQQTLRKIKIIMPTKTLMQSFISAASPIFSQIKTLQRHNEMLTKARDLLLPRLMNGEVSL